MSTLKLGYWDIRALGQPIRNLLRYVGVPFDEVRYSFGQEGSSQFPTNKHWLQAKFTLGLDFPNLPYLIDGDVKLTQSGTIMQYLARKYNLRAVDPQEMAKEDMLEQQIVDIRTQFAKGVGGKKHLTGDDVSAMRADLALYLTQLEQWIGEKQWLTGDRLSYVDFMAYECIDWYREFIQPDCLDQYPKMSDYIKRFEQLEPLKDYLASDDYRKEQVLSPITAVYKFKTKPIC